MKNRNETVAGLAMAHLSQRSQGPALPVERKQPVQAGAQNPSFQRRLECLTGLPSEISSYRTQNEEEEGAGHSWCEGVGDCFPGVPGRVLFLQL